MTNHSLAAPVLLIVFNRPKPTKHVFAAIRAARPKQLFISADGPRPDHPEDITTCQEVKNIVTKLDWPCTLQTNFREKNVGCKHAVASAITWFHEHVDSGIILEDDCVPHLSFFTFCEELLRFYQDDERIMQISGSNFTGEQPFTNGSYYFSKLNDVWGWATWRRAWKHFNVTLDTAPHFLENNALRNYFSDQDIYNWFLAYLKEAYQLRHVRSGIWSTQWQYAIAKNNGLTAVPHINLVRNIGIGKGATNATARFAPYQQIKSNALLRIKHPSFVVPSAAADRLRFLLIAQTDPRAHSSTGSECPEQVEGQAQNSTLQKMWSQFKRKIAP